MRECLAVSEDEDDCRYRLEAFFGQSIPPEGAGQRLDVPVFNLDGSTGSWRTLVVQATFNQPVLDSGASAKRLAELHALIEFHVGNAGYGVVGGIDFRPDDANGWVYVHAHDCGPIKPLIRQVLDGTKLAKRYSLEEFDGVV